MGYPTLSSDEIRQRNEEILAYADGHSEITKMDLGKKYGLNRETIRVIIERGHIRARRNQLLAAKAKAWGLPKAADLTNG